MKVRFDWGWCFVALVVVLSPLLLSAQPSDSTHLAPPRPSAAWWYIGRVVGVVIFGTWLVRYFRQRKQR